MSYRTEWDALAARIEGLAAAGLFVVTTGEAVGTDFYSVTSSDILPHARRIFAALGEFNSSQGAALPPQARAAIGNFLQRRAALFTSDQVSGFSGLQGMVAVLQSIRCEVSYLLADPQHQAFALVERAFAHLKRSIVVDDQLAARWRTAFATHETHCERLGAVHLLAHGLWGFKASAKGAATDLVLGHPVGAPDRGEASAAAMVLTEWKRVRDPKDLEAMVLAPA